MSRDGRMMVVPHHERLGNSQHVYAVVMYRLNDTLDTWEECGVIATNAEIAGLDYYTSYRIAVSEDFMTVAITDIDVDTASLNNVGKIYVYNTDTTPNTNTTWNSAGVITGNVAQARLGTTIKLSHDGEYLMASAPGFYHPTAWPTSQGDDAHGSLHVYKRDGTSNWTKLFEVTPQSPPPNSNHDYGFSQIFAVSRDLSTYITGYRGTVCEYITSGGSSAESGGVTPTILGLSLIHI
mgnify:FL=1